MIKWITTTVIVSVIPVVFEKKKSNIKNRGKQSQAMFKKTDKEQEG